MDQPDEEFRSWLERRLASRRMSARQLAERSGVNVSTVTRVLRGHRRISLRTAQRLAEAVVGTREQVGAPDVGSASTESPIVAVERALRADHVLDEPSVKRLMIYYLRLRTDRELARAERAPRAVAVVRRGG